MLRVHICEDNTEQREYLKQYIKETIDMENMDMQVGIVESDPEAVLKKLNQETENGVFFLDIDLKNQINGLELAKRIREYQPRCYIIFVTTHSEMSYMTFKYKVEAMDYIIKDDYRDMKNRIYQCLMYISESHEECAKEENVKKISVKIGSKIQEIPLDDIVYFEASANMHKIVLHTTHSVLEFIGKLKEIEKELTDVFCRCHRSCIVNKT